MHHLIAPSLIFCESHKLIALTFNLDSMLHKPFFAMVPPIPRVLVSSLSCPHQDRLSALYIFGFLVYSAASRLKARALSLDPTTKT
ncbi:hypothetical protein NC651_012994 [Populus alba x Populus x berolinensis]|nr:hypothetical protein NC651_012994 [Populus alba x Populus x berolinensis]